MNSPLSYLLLMPLNRYQPFKRRFLIPWLLTCVLVTILVTAQDGTISKPDEVLVVFFAIALPTSLGFTLGYMLNFFGAKTGVLKGWFWYLYPLIWWLPLLQFVFNMLSFLNATQMITSNTTESERRIAKLKNMNLDQFRELFASALKTIQQNLESGALSDQEAQVVREILQSQTSSSSLGEILTAKFPDTVYETLSTLVTVLFDLKDKRRDL